MNNQGQSDKPQPGGRGSKRKKTAADDGKPVTRKNKQKLTQGEEEPEEVLIVQEVRRKSTRVVNGPKAGPSNYSPAAGHPAAEGAAAAAKSSGTASGNLCHPLGLLVQLAVTHVCSKGAAGTSGLARALESSGNLQLLSALRTWAKEDLGIQTEDEGGLSEPEGGALALQSPPRKKLRRDVGSPTELRSSGAKLTDKITSHMQEDGFMEQLEAHLVSKASQIVHAKEFFKSLLRQNVLEETDAEQTTGPPGQEDQQIQRAIKAACSKRAIASLFLALQSSSNERILLEILTWLETLQTRKKNQSITVVHEQGNDSVDDDQSEPGTSFKGANRGASAGERVAGNEKTLRKILGHFSHSELLRLSLVTKLWKEAARSLMLKRGNVVARLTCRENSLTCMDLEGFAAVLKTMKTVPFSEIKINIEVGAFCSTTAHDPLGAIDTILAKLEVKKASVDLGIYLDGDWCEDSECVGVVLAKKLLQDLGETLEELTLQGYPKEYKAGEDLMEQMAGNWSFPNLKILKIQDFIDESTPDRYFNYIKALLSRASNLVTFDTAGIFMFGKTKSGSNSTVDWLLQHEVDHPWKEIKENLEVIIRLPTVRLPSYIFTSTFDFDHFNRKFPRLLRACSATTLKIVELDVKFAIPFMTYGICFENVNSLSMSLDYQNLRCYHPAVLKIVRNFDFTSIFPTLTSVIVNNFYQDYYGPLPDSFVRFLEQTRFEEARTNRADNIKRICLLDVSGLTNSSTQFYAKMFPRVQKLDVIASERQSDIHLIGQNWPALKELKFRFSNRGRKNLDSIFCGLDKKEVAVLRKKDENYLKTVEVVPVKSGITSMKNLRTLTLIENDPAQETALTMTKVAGLVAFSRCPNLQVAFKGYRQTRKAMSHNIDTLPLCRIIRFDPSY